MKPMQTLKLAILATLLFTTAVAIASFVLPVAPGWQGGWLMYHVRLILAIGIPALQVIAALFFFLGLQGFKEESRKAYSLIATGIIIIGFLMLTSPVVTFYDLWDTPFMTYGIPNIPFIVPLVVILAGLRVFYKQLAIRSLWRNTWFIILLVGSGMLLVLFLPHKPIAMSELVYDFGNAMFAMSSVFMLIVGINMLVIRKHLSPTYAKVLGWLAFGVITEAVLIGSSIIAKTIGLEPRSLASLQDVLILTALPYLRAGILFYKLTADTRPAEVERNASAVDIVLYVASLASHTNQVDPILDGVRDVTSRLREGEPLSVSDQAALGDVYLALERYLTQQEPLRVFTVEKLRRHVHDKFKKESLLSAGEAFWDKLPLTDQAAANLAQPKQLAAV